jgi:hypothetical protein
MGKTWVFSYLFLIVAFLVKGQDTLFLKKQIPLLVKVLEIKPKEISYLRLDYLDGPIYSVLRSEVLKIHFLNGLKDYYSEKDSITIKRLALSNQDTGGKAMNLEERIPKSSQNQQSQSEMWNGKPIEQLTYRDGEWDARQYYTGYKGSSISSFFGGMSIVYGLPIPLLTSISSPKNYYLFAPNLNALEKNKEYAFGFKNRAHKIKAGKAWANYGYGMATSTGILAAFLLFFCQT